MDSRLQVALSISTVETSTTPSSSTPTFWLNQALLRVPIVLYIHFCLPLVVITLKLQQFNLLVVLPGLLLPPSPSSSLLFLSFLIAPRATDLGAPAAYVASAAHIFIAFMPTLH